MKKLILGFLFLTFLLANTQAHESHYEKPITRNWQIGQQLIKGSFLFSRNDSVFIEKENFETGVFPISSLSHDDQKYLNKKNKDIALINTTETAHLSLIKNHSFIAYFILTAGLLLLALSIWKLKRRKRIFVPVFLTGFSAFLMLSFTNPETIRNAFLPFLPHVNTFWDNEYFYVESKGIPHTHTMMVGISNHGWQQQVPIPQCYIGTNAWSIPLNPVMATNPIPVDQIHFTRGAIAIAVNGVPIFNPYTNTGADAYLDGQLDNYGGHCGRGDDYHYHTAPLHLYNHTSFSLPIAYAFDGFAVFGNFEPDGTPMNTLDNNHGHFYNGDYHYHGTATAPYMIAQFAGVVTEDNTHQLIPQAQAHPVRTENWTPLNGALITSCIPNGTGNGYQLSYTLNGTAGYDIHYFWNGTVYTFEYVTPNGTTTIEYNGFNQCEIPLSVSNNMESDDITAYPNPFNAKINLKNETTDAYCILYNSIGQIVFSGRNIELHSFQQLDKGVYFLNITPYHKVLKLIKN